MFFVGGTTLTGENAHLTEETNPPAPQDDETAATAVQEPGDEQPAATSEMASTEADAAQSDGIAEEPQAAVTDAAPAEADTAAVEEPTLAEAEAATEAPLAEAASSEEVAPEPVVVEAAPADNVSAEPMTMQELLDQPDVEVKSLKHGDVVEGTVVRIDPDEILVDFGGKSEGVVSNRELIGRRGGRDGGGGDDSRPEIKVGDEVLVYVLQPESPEGHAVLSLRRAGLERKWRAMQERFEAGEIVEARVIDHNKGGLIVDLGVRGWSRSARSWTSPAGPRE